MRKGDAVRWINNGVMLVALAATVPFALVTSYLDGESRKPFCQGGTCQGKDPSKTNCESDEERVVAARGDLHEDSASVVGRVELIYSPRCDSNWGLVRADQGSRLNAIKVEIYPVDRFGERDRKNNAVGRTAAARDVRAWTVMVDANEKDLQGQDEGQRYCVEVIAQAFTGKACAD